MTALLNAPLLAAALLAAAGAHAQVTPDPLPTQLVCQPSDSLTVSVSRDAAGTPLRAGIYVTSGTHECDLSSAGPATVQPDGSWRFAWADKDQADTRYRATVKRDGSDGYTLAFEPARCGTLVLPASSALAPKGKGCKSRVDRDGAFLTFWRQFREAVFKRDGDMLQRLSLPQLEFTEGPDMVKAPSSIIRNAASCLTDVPTNNGDTDIGKLLKALDAPRLDMPPWSRRGDSAVDAGGAFEARWTAKGWRLSYFNASRAVFSECKP